MKKLFNIKTKKNIEDIYIDSFIPPGFTTLEHFPYLVYFKCK